MTQLMPLDQPAIPEENLGFLYQQVGLLQHTLSVLHSGADRGIFSEEFKPL